MRTYKEEIENFIKSGGNLPKLLIANDIYNHTFKNRKGENIILSDAEFEIVCEFIYQYMEWIDCNVTRSEICETLDFLFREYDYSISDLSEDSRYYEDIVNHIRDLI